MEQIITSAFAAIAEYAELTVWIWVQGILQMNTQGLIRFVVSGMLLAGFYGYTAYLVYKTD